VIITTSGALIAVLRFVLGVRIIKASRDVTVVGIFNPAKDWKMMWARPRLMGINGTWSINY
jgi:hypothetical protein